MRRWELAVTFDKSGPEPLFLQLVTSLAEDIRRGRLVPGEALPGSRELAARLGASRNTVIAAYAELVAEGLLFATRGGGTFVAQREANLEHGSAASGALGYSLGTPGPSLVPAPRPPRAGALSLVASPDPRVFPARALARAFGNALAPRVLARLAHSDPRGDPALRAGLAAMLSRTRGFALTPDFVLVTRGIVQGIDFAARALVRPGDVVAVEALGYPPAWNALRLAGARLVPVPLDSGGLDVAALEALASREPIRAVLVTPHHQFPTSAVMSRARRSRLAALAARHRFVILEDDDDHEFHYEGKPLPPIAAAEGFSNTIYIGSLANLLPPGISAGFVLAPPAVLERLVGLRLASAAEGDAAVERAIAGLFEDGELVRHARRMRRTYASRRDALVAALQTHLRGALQFNVPDGGMAIWARVDDAIDVDAWASAGESEGVLFAPAHRFAFAGRAQPFLRLGFTSLNESELAEAAHRMGRALAHLREPVRAARR
jgi:GntR family transcriptional regulator/MocR family aminotransferase